MRRATVSTNLYRLGALATMASLAFAVAACGGGGGSSTTPSATTNTNTGSNPITGPVNIVNFTGPGTKVSLSIAIPQPHPASAAVHTAVKSLGARSNLRGIRTMANTSPSSKLRTLGAAEHDYQAKLEAAQGRARGAMYISSQTYYMEFVVADSLGNVLVDELAYCNNSGSTCTGTFDAPVQSGLTMSLFLYDNCAYLLGAGTLANQTVTEGSNNAFTITVNGVAAYLVAYVDGNSTNPLYAQQPATFQIDVVALDADDNLIVAPGAILDPCTFQPMTSISLNVQNLPSAPGFTPTSATLTVPNPIPSTAPLVSQQFAWDGTGQENGITFAPSDTTGGTPVAIPSSSFYYYNGYPYYVYTENTTIGTVPATLSWTNVEGYSGSGGAPSFVGNYTNPGSETDYWLELPTVPANGSQYTVGLSESVPYTGAISLTEDGNFWYGGYDCSSIINPVPNSLPYSSGGWTLTFSTVATGSGLCEILAQDTNGNYSALDIWVDQSSLTIQQHARGPAALRHTGGAK